MEKYCPHLMNLRLKAEASEEYGLKISDGKTTFSLLHITTWFYLHVHIHKTSNRKYTEIT